MIKQLLLLPLAALLFGTASAQFRYTFKDTTTPYVPLSASAPSVNGSTIWYGDNYVAPMPFSWTMDSTIPVTGLPLTLGVSSVTSDTLSFNNVNGFFFAGAEIVDRGALGSSSLSPIRYATTGTAPNRIFKLEFVNAGFAEEAYSYLTLNDSFNVQIWVYEGSNIVELHYGPSQVTYPADYFADPAGGNPFIAYMKHVDFDMFSSGKFYYVSQNILATGIDSLDLSSIALPLNVLNSWPQSGRVFRFTPKTTCLKPSTPTFTTGTPSGMTATFTYTGTTTGIDSVVWNWGDGIKQTIATSLTTPVTYTYANAGRYNVTVTAYNSCGSTASAVRQASVFVGSIAVLGDVKVYPNPAHELLTIEGLKSGNATVLSVVGAVMMREAVNSTKSRLNIALLPAGTYTLLLTDENGASGAMQFVKQ